MAAKKSKKPLKKNQYRCIGGPVEYLYLPGIERGEYKTPLPSSVHYNQPGQYDKRYDPESDTTYYEWTEK